MNKRILGGALLLLACAANVAVARNFHCAGGIQYVIQGMAEKGKGNLDDAHRIFGKAVAQLTQCTKEDPNDNESWSYYAWAYAELDSAPQAGAAFDEAEKRLAPEAKKLADVKNNRHHYWVDYYNAGLAAYKAADAIVPVADILNSKDPNVDKAKAKLVESEASFKKAVAISSKEMAAYNNLAIVQALQGKFDDASATVTTGLAIDPNDADLKKRRESMVVNFIADKIKNGDYPGALADLDASLAKDPTNFNTLVQAAQVAYEWGDKIKDKDAAGAKAAYVRSMGYYGKAVDVAPDAQNKHDMRLNQAIAAQNAGDDLSEAKFAFQLVQDSPKEKDLHLMLRGAYDRMGSKQKSADEVWVILALTDTATPDTDIPGWVAKAPKGSEAAKAVATLGPPEELRHATIGTTKIDVLAWWAKKQVFCFSGGRQIGSANFGEFGPETFDKGAPNQVTPGGAKPSAKPAAKPGAKAPVKKG